MTYLGQLVGASTMLVGLVMLALPLSIIGTNFIEEDTLMKAPPPSKLQPSPVSSPSGED